jgi:hypothetical protein
MALAVLGLGGVLAGLIESALSFVRRFPTWAVSLALAAALALAGGAAHACGESVLLAQPAWVLSGALTALLLVRSRHSLAGRQLVQGAALIVVGVALVGYATYRLEQGLDAELTETDFILAQASEPIDTNSPPARLARTDAGASVPLFEASSSSVAANQDEEARYLKGQQLAAKLIQTARPDVRYNCHGWVFADGRYWVRGNTVETILKDNGYQAVERPRAGDVAVFRNQLGEVTHTGLVRAGDRRGAVLIESKWGRFGRYVHGPEEHGYRGHALTYYRTTRPNHLLTGVENPAPAAPATNSGG